MIEVLELDVLHRKKEAFRRLLNPELSIEYQIELEIILAITLFITKSDMIYKIYNKNNNTDQFFILKNMKINK